MKLTYNNENYAATVVEIRILVPLDGCDFVQAAIIMGNQVIVGKDVKEGDIGLYFPLETQLTEAYLKYNNLYRKSELNLEPTKKGFFEENGRVRCVKFRGHKSEGLFMPLESVGYACDDLKLLQLKDTFDSIGEHLICKKYIIKRGTVGLSSSKKGRKQKRKDESRLVENQFKFHDTTSMLYKNLHKIEPKSLISITYKMHGTSGISSYILCKRNISVLERIGAFIHNLYTNVTTLFKKNFRLIPIEYDYIYSSRKVIKNEFLNQHNNHFYKEDIWEMAHNELKDFLQKGITFYYEIVGFLPSGKAIQKDYDYGYSLDNFSNDIINIGDKVIKSKSDKPFKSGNKINTVKGIINHPELNIPAYIFEEDDSYVECRRCFKYKTPKPFGIYIYRITYTNVDGKVFEFSAKQVQDFCKKNGLNAVPELFYGYASELSDERMTESNWEAKFLETVKSRYNEKDCYLCTTKVPEEGVVIRVEGLDLEVYKQKSNAFYALETKLLDKGEIDIEEEN